MQIDAVLTHYFSRNFMKVEVKAVFSTIEEVFPEIEKQFDKQTLGEFLACDFRNLNKYHFGLGLWIRNHLLVENKELKTLFVSGGVTSYDDISALIIRLFYIYVRNKQLDR